MREPSKSTSTTGRVAYDATPTAVELEANAVPSQAAFTAFLRAHRVRQIVVDELDAGPWPAALAALHLRGKQIGGVLLYTLPRRLE